MTGIVIQARLGSERLPAKVMLDIDGKPLIHRIIDICFACKSAVEVIVVTPDIEIANYVKKHTTARVSLWEQNYRDVLAEYIQAAKTYQLDIIVRITADCVFHRADVMDYCIEEYHKSNYLYVYNTSDDTSTNWPEGLDCEVFSMMALRDAFENATGDEREHVTLYIRKHYPIYAVKPFEQFNKRDYFSINTLEDYKRALRQIS